MFACNPSGMRNYAKAKASERYGFWVGFWGFGFGIANAQGAGEELPDRAALKAALQAVLSAGGGGLRVGWGSLPAMACSRAGAGGLCRIARQADGGYAASGLRREAGELGAGEEILPVTPLLKRVPLASTLYTDTSEVRIANAAIETHH